MNPRHVVFQSTHDPQKPNNVHISNRNLITVRKNIVKSSVSINWSMFTTQAQFLILNNN